MRNAFALPFRLAAWCALLAVVLQLAAMPLANAHMLQRGLELSGSELAVICTPQGSEQMRLGDDGQPIKSQLSKWMQCQICLVGGSAPLITGSALLAYIPLVTSLANWQPVTALALNGAGSLWPYGRGPPA